MANPFANRLYRTMTIAWLTFLLAMSAAGIGAFYLYTHKAMPKIQGAVQAPGLSAPATIFRDRFGIPHCYADNQNDLFFLSGYAQAQDRLFQMDLLRRTAQGRLAKWKGRQAEGQDRLARQLGFTSIAKREYPKLDPGSRVVLDAFAAGVNAYAGSGKQALPLEYEAIKGNFEPWQSEDSLAILFLVHYATLGQEAAEGSLPDPENLAARRDLVRNIPRLTVQSGMTPPVQYYMHLADLSLPSACYLIHLHFQDLNRAGSVIPGFPLLIYANAWENQRSEEFPGLDFLVKAARRTPDQAPPLADFRGSFNQLFLDPPLQALSAILAGMMSAHQTDEGIARAWIQVRDWKGEMEADSAAPLFYAEVMRQAMILTYEDEVPAGVLPFHLDRPSVNAGFGKLLMENQAPAFNDRRTTAVETRDDLLLLAIRRAIAHLEKRYGPRMSQWKWGEAHRLQLRHPLGDEELLRAVNFFKVARPSPPMPGGRDTIWNGYYNWTGDYSMTAGTSLVLMMDAGRPDELQVVYAGGQSGQPFSPHYADLLQHWLRRELVTVRLDRKRVEAEAESVLRLLPQRGKAR